MTPAMRATPGRPWRGAHEGPSLATKLSRAIVRRLARGDCGARTLNRVAVLLLAEPAPEAAAGAAAAARAAFLSHDPQTARISVHLIGALAIPGWSETTLGKIGRALLEAPDAGVDADLRDALEGSRR